MSILIKNASHIVTFNDHDDINQNCDLLIEGESIIAVGQNLSLPSEKTQVIDARGMVV